MFGLIVLYYLAASWCSLEETDAPSVQESSFPKLLVPRQDVETPDMACTDVHRLLQRWESQSKQQGDLSASARQKLRMSVGALLNGHAALAAEQLAGRVRTAKLEEEFSWSIIERAEDQIRLEARPNDETELLFYGSIDVWLSADTFQLTKLQVNDRLGHMSFNWVAENSAYDAALLKVAYTSPSPATDGELPIRSSDPKRQRLSEAVNRLASTFAGISNPSVVQPSSDPTDLSAVTPELEAILEKRQASTRDIKTARIRFLRITYNNVFETETHGTGELFYQAPNKVAVTIRDTSNTTRTPIVAGKSNQRGKPFTIVKQKAETSISDGNDLVLINDHERTYCSFGKTSKSEWSAASQDWLVRDAYVDQIARNALLLDIDAKRIRENWSLSVVENTPRTITLMATPRTIFLKFCFQRSLVKIDPATGHTLAVRLFDLAGLETVYVIESRELNVPLPENCFTRHLTSPGYRDMTRLNDK